LVSIDGDADLSALATKAELASGLADKLKPYIIIISILFIQ
jgi:hypothetical protein